MPYTSSQMAFQLTLLMKMFSFSGQVLAKPNVPQVFGCSDATPLATYHALMLSLAPFHQVNPATDAKYHLTLMRRRYSLP